MSAVAEPEIQTKTFYSIYPDYQHTLSIGKQVIENGHAARIGEIIVQFRSRGLADNIYDEDGGIVGKFGVYQTNDPEEIRLLEAYMADCRSKNRACEVITAEEYFERSMPPAERARIQAREIAQLRERLAAQQPMKPAAAK